MRVLYADDELDLLDLSKIYLETDGELVINTVSSARLALEQLNTRRYDAILSDYQMPEMDGIAFLKQVRATDKSIPFIIFTGKGREEIAIEAFENGADFYIQKGGEPNSQFAELSNKIKKAVNHRRADMQVTALNRLYNVLSATNKAIVRIHDRMELLNEVCRIVVDIGGFRMAWAGYAYPEKAFIKPVAAYGYIDGYLDTVAISTDDTSQGRGPAGTAFRERAFTICNDVASDPKMAPWREGALRRGYHSVASFPFALDTKNAGVISFYASETGFFTDQIIRLLDEQSGDLTFAFVTLDHEEQRISAENDVRTSELQYRRLFETAQDAILILDGNTGEVIDANQFMLDMLGYTLEYFVGKHLWELGFIKDKSIAQHAFTELKTNDYIRYEDLPLETKDGLSIDVEFISNVYLVGEKKIIQCNIRNITDKKVIQDAMQVSETRYRRLFETAQDGILILDEETGTIIDANKFILDMLGYPLEYFVGKHLWELGFIKDKSIAQQAFTELKTKGYIRYEDLPLETKDGRIMNVEFISNAYPVNSLKIIQCNIRDITARKRTEDALALTSRKLLILSTITRHDINNQLMSVNGFLELLHKKVPDPILDDYFSRISKASARITSMIRFTKEYEQIGVNAPAWQVIRTLVETASKEAPLGHVLVKNDLPAGTEVFADPLVVKVIYNLMDNAVRHGEKITSIRFFVVDHDGDPIIVCEDDGEGVPVDEKEKIFERGFGKNTGLGLFISREILNITGITITETGEAGKGARFEMIVPKGMYRQST